MPSSLLSLSTVGLILVAALPASGDRVRAAAERKRGALVQLYRERGLAYPPREIFLRVLKRERTLELWARSSTTARFVLVKAYPICAASGELGPKRRAGDSQVPEGFYAIDRMNPRSAFHLSLGLDYPNPSDRRLGARGNLGGDIFIHGGCASIGCVSIGDDAIDEVYLSASAARARGQRRILVHLFPTRLDATGLRWLAEHYAARPELLRFWASLQAGFARFEAERVPPEVASDARGAYRLVAARAPRGLRLAGATPASPGAPRR